MGIEPRDLYLALVEETAVAIEHGLRVRESREIPSAGYLQGNIDPKSSTSCWSTDVSAPPTCRRPCQSIREESFALDISVDLGFRVKLKS